MTRKRTSIVVARNKRGTVIVIVAALALAASAAIAQVWTHQQAIAYGYEITRETKRHARLLEQNRRLRIELAVLKDPARISKLARQRFGLADPEPEQIHRLRLKSLHRDRAHAEIDDHHGATAPFRRRQPKRRRASFGVAR
jgi:cell division protein FtsL